MPIVSAALARFSAWERRRQITWLLLGAGLLLILATPLNLVHGFLEAEEGTTYFRYARLAQPMRAFLAPHQQYFGLFPNAVAVVVARILPISWAAVVSAWLVLLVHLWTFHVVATCERFTTGAARLLAAAAIFLAPGAAAVVVGSTQTQFIFALQCLVVLISDPDRHRVSRTLCTIMGGLDGVVSCVLTPFFLYRAWRTGSRVAWLQAIILCTATAIQGLVMIHALPYGTRGSIPHRSVATFINVLSNHLLVLPFLTRFVYHPVSLLGHAPVPVYLVFALFSVAGFAFLAMVIWPAGPLARALLLTGLFHACCGAMGMEGPSQDILGGGERYFFAANAAIAIALVLRWQQNRNSPVSPLPRAAACLLGLLLFSGTLDMVRFWKLNQSGAVWADQVRAWRQDPAHVTLTANPSSWSPHRMFLTTRPTSLNVPFYIFDSNTRQDVLERLPSRLFGPDPAGTGNEQDGTASGNRVP